MKVGPVDFVDLHCHLLPGIDDGPHSWEESLEMARLAVADGISAVVATPHQLGNYGNNDSGKIRSTVRQFQEHLDRLGIRLRVVAGADVRIEPDTIGRIRAGEVMTLADRGRYVLLELPHELYFPLDRLLSDFRAAGLIAVLSHPERNVGLLGQGRIAEHLVDVGCLLQVTAASLVGVFGPQVKEFAEWLVVKGLAHFIATDAHGVKSRRPLIRRAYNRAVELAGEPAARELCSGNPACVLADRIVSRGPRKQEGRGPRGWFRWCKAG